MFRHFLFIVLVSVVFQLLNAEELSNYNGDPKIIMEPQCASRGGMCMKRSDCPKGMESSLGSCPKQRSLNAVCCEGLPLSETRCSRRGGECMKHCPEDLLITEARNCPKSEPKCCPLV